MKKFGLCSIALFSLTAFANPGDYLEKTRIQIQAGLESCGLKLISGQDLRLPYQVAARNVDEVVVRELASGAVIPGVLVDLRGYAGSLVLQYSRVNGGLILQVARDYDYNDIAFDTSHGGRVAYSNTYWYGSRLVTDYVINQGGSRYVSESIFYGYVDREVIKQFIHFVCSQTK